MQSFTHDTYISPLTWRYGSEPMRFLFSETHKRRLLRRVWIALASAQMEAGLVTEQQVSELKAHQDSVDIDRAMAIEAEIHHDLMAEIKTYAEQCPNAAPIIHLGATSMDILDNMDALRLKEALGLLIKQTETLLSAFVVKMETYADTPCMAFTHIQPAEPTTVGYRFAQTAQDLKEDLQNLIAIHDSIRGKGMKGAVGTSASYTELL
ncbi:MAG: adenylosuccinate lyase, partial [Spirochaetales bacterium]|nr:adenylosuccinate lyase [Spirochaetales bacterium]